MWEEQNQKTNKYKTRMVLLDESGKKASAVYSTPLALSMCEPVVTKSGTVVWYVTNNDSPVFVEINPYRLSKVQADTKTTTTFKQDKTGSFDNSKKSGYRKGDVVIRDKKDLQSYIVKNRCIWRSNREQCDEPKDSEYNQTWQQNV